jgi:hypothetical protein
MSRNSIICVAMVSLLLTTCCFAGIFDDFKIMDKKEVEKLKKENEALKQENKNLKQQLANTKKISYQNIAQSKYKTTVLVSDNYLIDGDKKGAKLSPKWYELDFHYSRIIDKVVVYLTPTEEIVDIDFYFYYYDPVGNKWNSIKTVNNEGKNVVTVTFEPLITSKLKIYPTTNSPKPLLNLPIAEIEVFGWVIEK